MHAGEDVKLKLRVCVGRQVGYAEGRVVMMIMLQGIGWILYGCRRALLAQKTWFDDDLRQKMREALELAKRGGAYHAV